jgi:hypothetical protein
VTFATTARTADDVNTKQAHSAIAELSATLTTDFDVPALLAAIADHARMGHDAVRAAVLLVDQRRGLADNGIHVVAEAPVHTLVGDMELLTTGPALASATDGIVTMIDDLAASDDTRWPNFRRRALDAGIRATRAFPIVALRVPLGSIVVHTAEPWGSTRSSTFGQTLANIAAIALSSGVVEHRRVDISNSIEALLGGATAVATATGILAEVLDVDIDEARGELSRLARAHGARVTAYGRVIVEAHDRDPSDPEPGWSRPPELPPPPRIDGERPVSP